MEVVLKVLGIIALIVVLAILFSFPTMWLWNWLMPTLFGLTKITWVQALGINVLSGILFRPSSGK
jgi:hypothetical protein